MCEQLPAANHPQESAPSQKDYIGVRTRSMVKDTPETLRFEAENLDSPLDPQAEPFIMPHSPEEPVLCIDKEIVLSPDISENIFEQYTPDQVIIEDEISIPHTPTLETLSPANKSLEAVNMDTDSDHDDAATSEPSRSEMISQMLEECLCLQETVLSMKENFHAGT